jgi:uncharacterized protein YkwD
MKKTLFPIITMVLVLVLVAALFIGCGGGGSSSSGGGGVIEPVGEIKIASVTNLTNPNQALRAGDWCQINSTQPIKAVDLTGFDGSNGRAVSPPTGSYAAFTDGATTVQATLYSSWEQFQVVCRVPDGIPTANCGAVLHLSSGVTTASYPLPINPVHNPSPQPTPPTPTPTPTPTPSPTSTVPQEILTMEEQVKTLVDNERTAQGKPALAWNQAVRDVARKHSQDMIDRNFFSHVNPSGLDPFQRLTAAAITYTAAAENIAQNQGYADPGAQAVIGWMNSTGHRNNILDVNNYGFSQTGVGIAKKADGTYFFTQVFIKP